MRIKISFLLACCILHVLEYSLVFGFHSKLTELRSVQSKVNPLINSRTTLSVISMKIVPISRKAMRKVCPPSKVSIHQYGSYWGTNSMERVQRIFESVIVAYGGAWLAWFSSFMVGSLVSAVIGTALVLNWVYLPWLNARRRNAKMWPSEGQLYYALFSGRIISLKRLKRRAGKMIGAVAQEYLQLIIADESERELEVITTWQDCYSHLRAQMKCETIIASPLRDFSSLYTMTELWVPSTDCWVGDYPYLRRDKFENLVFKAEAKNMLMNERKPDGNELLSNTFEGGRLLRAKERTRARDGWERS